MKGSNTKGRGGTEEGSEFVEAECKSGGSVDKFKILIWREFELSFLLL